MTVDAMAMRLLTLIYDLSDGTPGVVLERSELGKKAAEMGLFTMTEDEFRAYKQEVRERVRQKKLSDRLYVLVCDMCDGVEGAEIKLSEVNERAVEMGIETMSDEEFEAYRTKVMERIRSLNN